MNRILIPILILLWSLLYSWFWNCERKPHCSEGTYGGDGAAMTAPITEPEVSTIDADVALDTVEVELTEAETEELLFTPLDVYFESAKAGIPRNAEIDNFLKNAKSYLAAHADKKLSIVGHTDSDGSEATNQRLSVSRASQVKDLLVAEGFSGDQLVVSGKGESEPKASNDTPEGKAQNRRVTVRLME